MLGLCQPKVKSASNFDITLKDPQQHPTDTISSISWVPSGNKPTFATSDWASYIRIYDLDLDSKALTQQACFDAQRPCLSVKWHEDEKTVFAGCTDGSVKSYDVTSGNCSLIGNHEGPVKSVHWLSASNTLLTVSFDKTVRFWDLRQAEPTAVYKLDYKPFCSDVLFPYLAIGLSEAKCLIVDLTKAQEELRGKAKYLESPLKAGTQIISIKTYSGMGNKIGFGIGGNDGRCNISYFAQNQQVFDKLESVITFKPHATDNNDTQKKQVYPVNCLGFHPRRGHQFVCTGGGEGKMNFWDINQKNKTALFDFKDLPVNQVEIDPTGKYMAYALGYDWARGIQSHMNQPSRICVHALQDRELEYRHQNGTAYPIKYPEVY